MDAIASFADHVVRTGARDVLELGTAEEPIQYEYAPKCDPTECRL